MELANVTSDISLLSLLSNVMIFGSMSSFIFGCNTRNIFAGTTATVNIFNCTSIAQYIFGQSGTICKNTVAVTDSGISAFTGSFNAASTNNATYDGTAPGSNAIDLGAINPHFIISETNGSNPFDYRVVPTSALIGAGVDSGITADIDNQAISGSFPVGCSNGIALSSYATAANVIEGVDRGDGTLGTYHEATTEEVQDGVLFGPSSSYEGTYDPITGNYTDPGVSNVINDTSYTFAADEKTGTYAPAPESKVELNYQYGAGGTEYTGSYSPSLPTAPTLTITDSADGTGGAYTIASGEVTAVNKIYYFADAVDVSSTLIASRTGNGSGTVKITTMGTYWFYCITQTSGGYNISNLVRVTLTDGSDVSVSEEEDYIYDEGQQITVETRAQTIGARGARTSTWTTANTIWGWKQPTSSAIRIKYEERGILVTSKVFVAENPSVTEGDRLDISGTKFLVRGVVDQSGTGTLWRIDCEEVK